MNNVYKVVMQDAEGQKQNEFVEAQSLEDVSTYFSEWIKNKYFTVIEIIFICTITERITKDAVNRLKQMGTR